MVQQSTVARFPGESTRDLHRPSARHSRTKGFNHQLVAWDAAGKKMLYRTEQESFLAAAADP